MVFENSKSSPVDRAKKALEDAEIWLSVNDPQIVTSSWQPNVQPSNPQWRKPQGDLIKCNVGMAWDNSSSFSGAGWITRNSQGSPLQLSRRGYPSSASKQEADLQSLYWAAESMSNMGQSNIIFETSSREVREAFLKPHLFPDRGLLLQGILHLLSLISSWSLEHLSAPRNIVAQAIADSVIQGSRSQSYISIGGPAWLRFILDQEMRNST